MCARSIYHIHICFYIYMYTCTCVYVLARRQNIFCMHASECGQAMCACVWVREGECVWCSVLYASEPLPAGIRKVDLGHKYLISVCCPWKSSIYSQPNGKMPLSDPLLFSSRQKEMQRWEAVRGTLTWYGWSRTEATPEKKQTMLISCWWEVITGKLQMDGFHKASHCLFGLKRTVIRYNEKPITDSKILDIMCLILSNRISAKLKLLA